MNKIFNRIGQGGSALQQALNVAGQTISAIPSQDALRTGLDTGLENAVNRYGRPISEALNQGHKYIGDARQIGESYKQILQNSANSAMGFVRDNFGGLIPQGQARQMGYQTKTSRYGGRVVTNPDDDLANAQPYGDDQEMMGAGGEDMQPYMDETGPRNRMPRTAYSSRPKRAARQQRRETRRSNRSGKGMQFISNMFGGAMGALGRVGSAAATAGAAGAIPA